MNIHRMSGNINDYMFFTIDDRNAFKKMSDFDIDAFGKPLSFSWIPPKAEFIESDSGSKILPDITQWNGNDLIVSNKAKGILENTLKTLGEFHPLTGKCQHYWLFNPIHREGNDAINLEKTRSSYFDDGAWEKIEELAFDKNRANQFPGVFTLEVDRGVNLYCTQDLKEIIENAGLNGLAFTEQKAI